MLIICWPHSYHLHCAGCTFCRLLQISTRPQWLQEWLAAGQRIWRKWETWRYSYTHISQVIVGLNYYRWGRLYYLIQWWRWPVAICLFPVSGEIQKPCGDKVGVILRMTYSLHVSPLGVDITSVKCVLWSSLRSQWSVLCVASKLMECLILRKVCGARDRYTVFKELYGERSKGKQCLYLPYRTSF